MSGTRYGGVAEEVAYGTKQTADAAFQYLDFGEMGLDTPKSDMLEWEGVTHRSSQVVAPGAYIPEGDMAGAIDGVFFGWPLKWVLGTYYNCLQFDGGKEAYRHTFRSGTSLKSFTTRIGKEQLEQVFQGCKLNSMSIEIAKNEFAKFTAAIIAQQDSKATIKAETAIEALQSGFFTFVHGAISIASHNEEVDGVTIEINNNISGEDGLRIGSRFVRALEVNSLELPISVELPFGDTTHLEAYWGGASGPTDKTSVAVSITLTASTEKIDGTNFFTITFTFPRVFYKGIGQVVKGRDEIKQTLELVAKWDNDSDYDVQVTIDSSFYAYALECFFRCIKARSTTLVIGGGTRGKMHKTADGGATSWSELTTGLTAYSDRINCIKWQSDTVAYACGMDGKVLKTADAGATWSDVSSASITYDWYGLHVVDATTLYVVGSGGKIYYTADSGTNWSAKTSGITTDLYAIAGISDEFVAVGAGGKILNSSDGTTWTSRTSGVTIDLMSVAAFEGAPDLWIACGELGTILTSADAETWADKSIAGLTATLRGVDCTSATVAVVVGDADTCYYTSNAGTAWTEKVSGTTNVSLYSVSMASGSTWYLAGTFETVLKTTDTGANFTTQTI